MKLWDDIVEFFTSAKEIEETNERIAKTIKEHTEFIFSLDDRQKAYYFSLQGRDRLKWELVRLEKRVYDLEQKDKQ